jgi:hypothetical protein
MPAAANPPKTAGLRQRRNENAIFIQSQFGAKYDVSEVRHTDTTTADSIIPIDHCPPVIINSSAASIRAKALSSDAF